MASPLPVPPLSFVAVAAAELPGAEEEDEGCEFGTRRPPSPSCSSTSSPPLLRPPRARPLASLAPRLAVAALLPCSAGAFGGGGGGALAVASAVSAAWAPLAEAVPTQPLSPSRVFARLVQSSELPGGGSERWVEKASVPIVEDFPFDGPVIEISADQEQSLIGFGGAFTEASALMFQGLPPALQEQVLELYFGQGGLGFSLGRLPINSCDFSPESYTFDDVEGDYSLEHFDRNVTHDTAAMIPFIRAAMRKSESSGASAPLRLIAAPWSPPGWMKVSGRMDGLGAGGRLKDRARGPWAEYISAWIEAYKAHGVPIWAVTPQNEPENHAVWEGCVYTPDEEMDWIGSFLGPTLKREHPEVQVFAFDHNKDDVYEWAEALYSHTEAASFVSGVAFHWYTGDHFEQLRRIRNDFPQATLLATEATYERYRWKNGTTLADGDWDFGLGYAHDIIGDLNAGASGWMTWNLLLNMQGGPNHVDNVCDPALLTDLKRLYPHPQLYAMGHLSKYVVPGSKRLVSAVSQSTSYEGPTRPYGTCTGADGLEATAFLRPDSKVAVVVLNCGDSPIEFKLRRRLPPSAAAAAGAQGLAAEGAAAGAAEGSGSDGFVALRGVAPARALQTWLLPVASRAPAGRGSRTGDAEAAPSEKGSEEVEVVLQV